MKREGEDASHSVVSNSATPWTVARQAPLSMEFSRQECCSGLPFPSPGDIPNPGIKPRSPAWQADSLPSEPQGSPSSDGEAPSTALPFYVSNKQICHLAKARLLNHPCPHLP